MRWPSFGCSAEEVEVGGPAPGTSLAHRRDLPSRIKALDVVWAIFLPDATCHFSTFFLFLCLFFIFHELMKPLHLICHAHYIVPPPAAFPTIARVTRSINLGFRRSIALIQFQADCLARKCSSSLLSSPSLPTSDIDHFFVFSAGRRIILGGGGEGVANSITPFPAAI